jgi:hypothetical protein
MKKITLPYEFEPRDYQRPLFEAFDSGFKRGIALWHRRSGKDITAINLMAKKMYERVGTYFYFFPTYQQGKKVIWNGMTKDGKKFLDFIPKQLRKRVDNTEMLIEMSNGSIFQIVGTDNIDSIVGTNPIGSVFSEYALQDPRAWGFIRPILAENDGWALFNYTPRGQNHGYDIWRIAEDDPSIWFSQKLTTDDTKAIKKKILKQELKEIVKLWGDEALYRQEYFCDFTVPISGAYYAAAMMLAQKEERITSVPYDPNAQVDTFWDLGVGDSTAIWFAQQVKKEIHLIDYYETSGEGLNHYIKHLKEKPYVYGRHYAPHDIEVRELSTGKTRKETAQKLGIDFDVAPRLDVDEGIDAARRLLPQCWFDMQKCELGINALRNYRKEFDEKNRTYKNRPVHDWSSHGSDAFRYLATSWGTALGDADDYNFPDDKRLFRSGGFY